MKNGRYEEWGQLRWYKDDRIHREDGPAVESLTGYKSWYVDGERHRLDGPAVEYSNGSTAWYVDGQKVDIIAVFGYLPSVPLTAEEQMILRLSV